MTYFARGSLPWQGLKVATEDERNEPIKEKKMNILAKDFCGPLPKEFATYLKYVCNLGFDDRPNYSYLRKLLRDLFLREGFQYDNVFDWTIKKPPMIREAPMSRLYLKPEGRRKATSVDDLLRHLRKFSRTCFGFQQIG
jgi:hypothetical protein